MWMHDYHAVLDTLEGVHLICSRERYVLVNAMKLQGILTPVLWSLRSRHAIR